MTNNDGATAPVTSTPPRNSGLNTDLKSTPHAVGSAIVSEHIDTLGVNVSDVRPWIERDVRNFKRCGADTMLQQLLEMCTDPTESFPSSEKSTLLDTCLEAVLPLCNGPGVAQKIKQHLTKFCSNVENETSSYTDFVEAANRALRGLRKVNLPGIPAFQDDNETNVLFHVNDPSYIHQEHQGVKSSRKPDVVVVSHQTAADIMPEGKFKDVYQSACKAPTKDHENFQWMEVRTTFEFKRPKLRLPHPPPAYNKDYVVPTMMYMEYEKDADADADAQPIDSTSAQSTDSTSAQPIDSTSAQPTDSTSATGPAQSSHKTSSKLQNISDRLRSNKRGSDHLSSNEPSTSKRSRQDEERQSKQEKRRKEKKKKEPKKIPPVVQNGLYAAEMFAAHTARQHVISFIVNNDIVYLWWFDRQHTIQCAGINFVQDLPRFLVLLFIMQRMGYKQWGLHPLFEPEPGYEGEIIVECEDSTYKGDKESKDKKKRIDLTLDLKSDKRATHFGLRGRATTVFPVRSKALSALPRPSHSLNESTEFVAKLFWPEEARQSEPEILEEVYKIATQDPDVLGHVPDMVWFHKFEDTSTATIRRALGIDDAGSRVLYIIVFRKLDPITMLSGEEFLVAWWEVVKCHRALWKRGIHHRDISPSNLMGYRLRGRFMSVLNDFDLSSIKRLLSSITDAPKGFERTGTVPFMSLNLLTPEAIAGEVEHVYRHDAESFIWVLTWICLRYENGKLLSKGRPLDEWLTVDAKGCAKEKAHFMFQGIHSKNLRTPISHSVSWEVARKCLGMVYKHGGPSDPASTSDEEVFQTWLEHHVPKGIVQADRLSCQ
ncbi:uncharacterized protein EDB93DRAFT_1309956 [Suillus bovinus]|uniref:uncharacterized protein n=1 Tax=Suillus bovinus TaxID=48563 RepID=UPI001B871EE4|nr:uncharacterized protein EDB93DRAFT_1309956 [Suillus bovinus]KAG2132299.1 hypothetical protein EDB93DRAFT_1309956 [Suillus bovinus]